MEHFIYLFLISIFLFFIWFKSKQVKILNKELLDVIQEHDQLICDEQTKYRDLLSKKKQSEIRVGQISEHFAPLLDQFKYDRKQARFLASPIDFIIFEEEEIIFMEVKTGSSQLNANQRRIKKQVEDKKVRWEVMRIK